MHDTTGDVRTFFQGYVRDFDAIYGHTGKRNVFERWIDRNLRRVMRLRFEETLKRTASCDVNEILDVGCGPGRYCVEFLNQGKNVVGIDFAPGMIEAARRATGSVLGSGKAEFVVGDYLAYEFRRKFDAACLMGFFDYIEDPTAVFKKLKREVRKEIYASFPKRYGVLARTRMIRYKIRKCPLFLYAACDIEKILGEVGLSDRYETVDCERDFFVSVKLGE